ncbi:MAG: RNA polymerase sigma factor [Thermoguttaceae bacterium]
MPEFPETRASLLVRIQSPQDEEAWREFAAIYRPVVYRLARKRGLQDADAEDLAQRVLIAVQRAIGNWENDPAKGRFRFWLARIAQNAIINALTRRPPDAAAGGTTIHELLEKQPQPDHRTQQELQREHRRSLFRWAAQRILPEFRDGTWDAFWLTTVEGMSVEEAGRALGKSLGAIYAARSRVMRRLKDEIQQSCFD